MFIFNNKMEYNSVLHNTYVLNIIGRHWLKGFWNFFFINILGIIYSDQKLSQCNKPLLREYDSLDESTGSPPKGTAETMLLSNCATAFAAVFGHPVYEFSAFSFRSKPGTLCCPFLVIKAWFSSFAAALAAVFPHPVFARSAFSFRDKPRAFWCPFLVINASCIKDKYIIYTAV